MCAHEAYGLEDHVILTIINKVMIKRRQCVDGRLSRHVLFYTDATSRWDFAKACRQRDTSDEPLFHGAVGIPFEDWLTIGSCD